MAKVLKDWLYTILKRQVNGGSIEYRLSKIKLPCAAQIRTCVQQCKCRTVDMDRGTWMISQEFAYVNCEGICDNG